ncbi:MAG: LysR family transcriptional regulator [Atopobiaceae bacterium]
MDLVQLRYLCEVVEQGSVTAAAACLHVSQPAISSMLRKLEAEVGGPLFDRSHNRMQLNDLGEVAYRHALQVLADVDSMEEELRRKVAGETTLRVAFCDSSSMWYCVPRFSLVYPEIRLETSVFSSKAECRRIALSQRVDALVTNGAFEYRGWTSMPLVSDIVTVSVVPDDPLASHTFVTLSELRDRPILLFVSKGSMLAHGEELWRSRGIQVEVYDDYFLFAQRLHDTEARAFSSLLAQTYRRGDGEDRVQIPVDEPDMRTDYWLSYPDGEGDRATPLIESARFVQKSE